MATVETASLGLETLRWLASLRRNIRTNCAGYQAQLTAGVPVATVATTANADAQQFQYLLNGLNVYVSDPVRRTKLLDGLSAFAIDQTAAANEINALQTAVTGQTNANKNTAGQINTFCNAILTQLVSYDLPARSLT